MMKIGVIFWTSVIRRGLGAVISLDQLTGLQHVEMNKLRRPILLSRLDKLPLNGYGLQLLGCQKKFLKI